MSQSKLSSALAALAVLALPGAYNPVLADQKDRTAAETAKSLRTTVSPELKPATSIVVVTGRLDLGKVKLTDFGDVDSGNR